MILALKLLKKYLFFLALTELLILIAAYCIIGIFNLDLRFPEVAFLSVSFCINTSVILAVFMRGQQKEPESQTMHSMVAVSLKFLIELFIALTWFIIAKKTGLASVLSFFVLYLAFTLFSMYVLLKTLKYKTL